MLRLTLYSSLLEFAFRMSLKVSARTRKALEVSTWRMSMKYVFMMNGCDCAPVCGFLTLPGKVTVIVVPFGSS